MILYHGSNVKVPYPDILFSRKEVDFGPGFYTTPIRQQAVDWCITMALYQDMPLMKLL